MRSSIAKARVVATARPVILAANTPDATTLGAS